MSGVCLGGMFKLGFDWFMRGLCFFFNDAKFILPDYLSKNPTNVKKVSFSEEKHLIMEKRLNWIETSLSVIYLGETTFSVSDLIMRKKIRIGVQLTLNSLTLNCFSRFYCF